MFPSARTNIKHAVYDLHCFVQVEKLGHSTYGAYQMRANLEEITDRAALKKIHRKSPADPVIFSAERLSVAQREAQDGGSAMLLDLD